jgi:two-component system, NarL family, response regulator NreC
VVAEASDGAEAIRKAIETTPEVAVLALALPLLNGIELTRKIPSRLPRPEVVIFTRHHVENWRILSVRPARAAACSSQNR